MGALLRVCVGLVVPYGEINLTIRLSELTKTPSARLSAERWFPLGGRLLGHARVGKLEPRDRQGAAPGEFEIEEVPLDDPIFHSQFTVTKVPQITNNGRIMVLMTFNTDVADSWD
jgi:hypothetical protein